MHKIEPVHHLPKPASIVETPAGLVGGIIALVL
jgi:hypothetical protein